MEVRDMNRTNRAFTLIEVLVVVSILGVLMGLVSVLVMKAGGHQNKNDAKQLVETYLPNMVESYKNDFHRWPPMSFAELNAVKAWKELASDGGNDTNECIEALVVALRHPDFATRLEDGDLPGKNPFGNTDEDAFNTNPAGSSTNDALEIVDPWGTPVIYIHKKHYGKSVTVIDVNGDPIEVEAVKRSDGTYYNQNKFQIISLGKNGKQDEAGAPDDDDIRNFTIQDTE